MGKFLVIAKNEHDFLSNIVNSDPSSLVLAEPINKQ
jgi:hypothetical protein